MSASKDIDQENLVKTIKAHIAKGDKAAEKANDHYIAAGQHLKTLKAEHDGNWAAWEELLKTKIGIGKSRASELMQIADGRKTVKGIAAATTERSKKHRALSPLRNGEPAAPPPVSEEVLQQRARRAERIRTLMGIGFATTNDVDPEVSAAAMKAKFAELDGDTDVSPASSLEPEPEPEDHDDHVWEYREYFEGIDSDVNQIHELWERADAGVRQALLARIGLDGILVNISNDMRREFTTRVVKQYVAHLPVKKRRAARKSENRMIEKLAAMPVQGNA
jgi:hypothetical protein